jgi:hypothetical protein
MSFSIALLKTFRRSVVYNAVPSRCENCLPRVLGVTDGKCIMNVKAFGAAARLALRRTRGIGSLLSTAVAGGGFINPGTKDGFLQGEAYFLEQASFWCLSKRWHQSR